MRRTSSIEGRDKCKAVMLIIPGWGEAQSTGPQIGYAEPIANLRKGANHGRKQLLAAAASILTTIARYPSPLERRLQGSGRPWLSSASRSSAAPFN